MIALMLRGRVHSLAMGKATYRRSRHAQVRSNGENIMLVKCNLALAGAMALAFTWCCNQNANAQGVFTITSSSFKDGERLATKMAGNNKQNPNCVGDNVSPALSWSNPPAGTKSYALIMYDPEGRGGLGVVHWVAYGIAASVTGLAEGETSKQTDKYVGGKSTMSLPHYFGPCTPAGAPHHYTFTLIATDLEPAALQPGMTRDEVMKALDGHAKAATGIIGTFSKP
jgi:Raf kinase inhibitor-like YbhB/YbcL family protein